MQRVSSWPPASGRRPPRPSGGPRSVVGEPPDAVTRIADFYGARIDARSGPAEGAKPAQELRGWPVGS